MAPTISSAASCPPCPSGYLNASQVASSTYAQGGEVGANGQREDVDAAGNFSMPIAFTPTKSGQFLICGYTNDGATTTLAASSLILSVQGSGPWPARVAASARREARQPHEAARNALCEKTRLQPGQLVERPEPLLLPLARERQAQAGRNRPDPRRHTRAPRPQGAVQSDGVQRRRRRRRSQPAVAHPLNLSTTDSRWRASCTRYLPPSLPIGPRSAPAFVCRSGRALARESSVACPARRGSRASSS
jgi:hypothetical protein